MSHEDGRAVGARTWRRGPGAPLALGVAAMLMLLALAAAPERAAAQDTTRARRPTTRRATPIEIRGTVPTPQVVTVRPRETPTYERRVLVPKFYDHDFWQSSILPGYQLVQRRDLTGALPGDSLNAARAGAPPAGGGATPPAPAGVADSTRRPPPGTAPAPTLR